MRERLPWWLGGSLDPGRDYWRRDDRDVDVDPYYLNGPAAPGQSGYPDVPRPMVPGLQPWQTGEPTGWLADPENDWRQRYLTGEAYERSAQPVICYGCNGSGRIPDPAHPSYLLVCGYCNGTGAQP